MTKLKPPTPKEPDASGILLVFISLFVEKFGVAGTIIIPGFLAIQVWANDDQKRQIVDLYILGKNPSYVTYGISIGVFILALLFQRFFYKRKIKVIQEENIYLQSWIEGRNNQKPRKKQGV